MSVSGWQRRMEVCGSNEMNKLPVWAVWAIAVTACGLFWVAVSIFAYGVWK